MDIALASAAATWLINKLLDRLSDYAIKKLLGSEGLDAEASSLRDALRRATLVLGAVPAGAAAGVRIGNDQLLPQIDLVQRLATDLARHLDELEYYDVKKKTKEEEGTGMWTTLFLLKKACFNFCQWRQLGRLLVHAVSLWFLLLYSLLFSYTLLSFYSHYHIWKCCA
uniref:Rx N-terminal domain-containing protein n=1 Tax=Oryza barthii TaxID=65489 RepID=A0A0D3GYM8_9ORYZ